MSFFAIHFYSIQIIGLQNVLRDMSLRRSDCKIQFFCFVCLVSL